MNRHLQYIATALIGTLIGFISGWQGISRDDMLMVILLMSGISANQKMAAGTALLAVLFPISLGAVWEYYNHNEIDVVLGLIITVAYTIAATFGAKMNFMVSKKTTMLSIIIMQILSTMYFIYDYMRI